MDEPLFSQIPTTQEIEAEFAWNIEIRDNVFGGEDTQYSTQQTQLSTPQAEAPRAETSKGPTTAVQIPPERTVRKKFKSAALKSPFRQIENRGTDFQAYMKNTDDEK